VSRDYFALLALAIATWVAPSRGPEPPSGAAPVAPVAESLVPVEPPSRRALALWPYYFEPDPCEGASAWLHVALEVQHRQRHRPFPIPTVVLHQVQEPARPSGTGLQVADGLDGYVFEVDGKSVLVDGKSVLKEDGSKFPVDRISAGDPPDGKLVEWITEPAGGGTRRAESWLTLFSLKDMEPADDCTANMLGDAAVFECARGDHPRVRVAVDGDALVVTTAHTRSPSEERRFPIPLGACIHLSASNWEESPDVWVPWLHRMSSKQRANDAFEEAAAWIATIPVRSDDRCADAPAGPEIEIRIVAPTGEAAGGPLIVAIPELGYHRTEARDLKSCAGAVFARTGAVLLQCLLSSFFKFTFLAVVRDGELWTTWYDGWSKSVPLPCNSRIRWTPPT
jgi:hypothetical protein